jgi:EmrB/QacA subfamily drug resistance transporter
MPAPGHTRGTRRRDRPNPAVVLAVILTCQLMVVLDMTIVNIALPDIKTSLHFSSAGLSWVINAYTLTFGGLLLLGARAGDILGRRRTFLAGIGLFTLASLAGGFAESSAELLTARAVQGIGGALASPSALALLMTMFSQGRERTRAIGLYSAVSIGGAAVGLIAGGMLTQWVSWRWVLFVNVPIGAALLLATRAVMPETPRHRGRFDLAGAITSTVGMAALVYGFVEAATDGWGGAQTLTAFVVGVFLLTAFVTIELRAPSPITPLRLFADVTRTSSYAARLLLTAGMMGMVFFLTQFLQDVLGYSALGTGVAFLPLTAALFAASMASSRGLVERFGGRRVLVGGLSMSTASLIWLTQLSPHSSYLDLLGSLLLFGLGNGLAFVPLTTAALDGVAPADAGAGSGLVNVMQQVGGSLGLAVMVTVFGAASAGARHDAAPGSTAAEVARHAFAMGADRAFLIGAIFLAAALVLSAVAVRPAAFAREEVREELREEITVPDDLAELEAVAVD